MIFIQTPYKRNLTDPSCSRQHEVLIKATDEENHIHLKKAGRRENIRNQIKLAESHCEGEEQLSVERKDSSESAKSNITEDDVKCGLNY